MKYRLIVLIILVLSMIASVFTTLGRRLELPRALEGASVAVEAIVTELPQDYSQYQKWIMSVDKLSWQGRAQTWRGRIVVYVPKQLAQRARVGDVWQFTTRLKRPHGYHNPGSWNKEAWFSQHNLQAQGSMHQRPAPHWLRRDTRWPYWLNQTREQIAKKINQHWLNNPWRGLVLALTLGVKTNITSQQWSLLRQTGVSHLIAISGLHISLVAGFFYLICSRLWRLWPRLLLLFPAQQAGWIGAWFAALLYAALAGFALPTQRALIMLSVFVIYQLRRRDYNPWRALLLAAFAVLLWDPFAVLAPGFWLSFVAVAWIFYLGTTSWIRLAFLMSLGLLPLSAYFFHQVSGISAFANLISVPGFSLIVIPGVLLDTLALLLNLPGVDFLSQSLSFVLNLWWDVLTALQKTLPWQMDLWLKPVNIVCLGVGVLLLAAPRGLAGRYLAPIFFLPLLWPSVSQPKPGELWLSVLDVGQGLAVVAQTQKHTLLYDTGPSYGSEFDAGKTVVIPFLQQQGIKKLDAIIISHNDRDHSGGLNSVLKKMPINKIYSSAALAVQTKACVQGQQWQWEGVEFMMLSPPKQAWLDKNNNSCVLKIKVGDQQILLPGDIEQKAEQWLVQQQVPLKADVLIAPHHGSRTSSSSAFIDAVAAKTVIVSSGYFNRFHFPATDIVAAYKKRGSVLINTAQRGAVIIRFQPRLNESHLRGVTRQQS